jgi:hypothetical protein
MLFSERCDGTLYQAQILTFLEFRQRRFVGFGVYYFSEACRHIKLLHVKYSEAA